MPTNAELEKQVDEILGISWSERDGAVIPSTDTIALKNGAVKLDATFLYADLAASSQLARLCPWETVAKIIRAYLDTSVKIIRSYGGEIRSFDGDRVMGVFIGDSKNTNAVKAGREIFYTVEHIIGPKAFKQFNSIKNNNIKIKNCVGIDTGISRAVRAGIRNNNDLIWIGKSPSFSAKLSDLRDYPYCLYISSRTYSVLPDNQKIDGAKNIWKKINFTFGGVTEEAYGTNYTLTP